MYAHEQTQILEPGQVVLGYNWNTTAAERVQWLWYPPSPEHPVQWAATPADDDNFLSTWPGEVFSFEYAVRRGWSIGFKTNPLSAVSRALTDGKWGLHGSVFTNIEVGSILWPQASVGPSRLFWLEEIKLSPLYTTDASFGNHTLTILSALTSSWPIFASAQTTISPFLDAGILASFPTIWYPNSLKTFSQFKRSHDEQWDYSPFAQFRVFPLVRLIPELGFEVRLGGNLLVNFGIALPIARYWFSPVGEAIATLESQRWDRWGDSRVWELEARIIL